MSLPAERSTRLHLDFGSKSSAARCRLLTTNLVSTIHVFMYLPSQLLILPNPFGTVPFRPVRPYILWSKLLPASRRGSTPICSQPGPVHPPPSNPTAPRTPLALARFPQLRQLGSAQVMPSSALMFMVSKWAQDMMLLLLLLLLLLPLQQLLCRSLTAQGEREAERSSCRVSRSRPSDSRGLSPLIQEPASTSYIIVIHPSTVPTRRNRLGTWTVLSLPVFLLRHHRQ